ncbi:MAG: amino acid permease [Planctomycetota bacterium]
MSDRTTPSAPKIGLISASCLVVANMIGAAVFTTSGYALRDLGEPSRVLIAWIIGGGIACCGAISYGALVHRITASGGEYVFLSEVVHPFVGFLAGWVSLWAGFTGAIAFAATSLEAYLVPEGRGVIAVASVVGCGILHLVGLRVGAGGQNAMVALKLVMIVGFIAWATPRLAVRQPDIDLPPTPFSLPAMAMALVWISLAYSGFNAAVYLAEDVRDPRQVVPRALLLGTGTVTICYLALNAIFVYTPPASAIVDRADVAAASAEILGGTTAAGVVRLLICLSLASSISSMIMIAPRVYARMANDGLLPQRFAAEEEPRAAIVLQVLLAAVVCLVTQLQDLLNYLSLTLSLSAAASVACLIWLRYREGAKRVPILGGLAAPCLYVSATLILAGLAASLNPFVLLGPLVTLLTGWIAYSIFRRPAWH